MAKTGAERVRDSRKKKIAAGLREVKVWVPRVPSALADKLRVYAKKLCESET